MATEATTLGDSPLPDPAGAACAPTAPARMMRPMTMALVTHASRPA
jgi:hypothetical protein